MNENIVVRLEKQGVVTTTFRKLHPEKKVRLYRVTLAAFSSEVFDRVSFDRLAEAAAVSKGSLFQYFVSKENLLWFACEIFLDEYRNYWSEYFAREHAVRVRDRVRSFFVAQLDYWAGAVTAYNFYVKMRYENSHELPGGFVEQVSRLQKDHLSSIVERGVKTGELRGDMSVGRIAEVLFWVFEGIFGYLSLNVLRSGKREEVESRIDNSLSLFFDGIGA